MGRLASILEVDSIKQQTSEASGPLSSETLRLIDAWWRAANYLSVGQIYLLDNPLLAEPLRIEHIKPRLLGHWGTTPGLNFIYAHANRVINHRDLNAMYVIGPGHGAPAILANAYLEGTYSEVYPHITQDRGGMQKLFRQFSFPGGIPSHVAAETPGSIHEGGEIGYSLAHAYGAAFDNPDLVIFCVIGDGESETGPLATSWHSNKFLNPKQDGVVVPILYLITILLAALPVIVAIVYRLGSQDTDPQQWMANTLMDSLIVTTLLPLVAVIFGTAAMGTEIEDGTAVYLLSKPVSRRAVIASSRVTLTATARSPSTTFSQCSAR